MYSGHDLLAEGLPHSDVHGSKPARGSPWLFAACHVLHRLLVPRHPPNALLSFNLLRLTTLNRRTKIKRLPTMHRNQSSQAHTHCLSLILPNPLGTSPFKTKTKTKLAMNDAMPAVIPCKVHGHHNRNHCTITHLNTRPSNNFWLAAIKKTGRFTLR